MILTPRISSAIELAARLHREHTRRDSLRTPYITHLISVMLIVSEVTDDEDTLIAALMHDALEDVTGYTVEMLAQDTSEKVAMIVSHVTEPHVPASPEFLQLPWLERKQAYIENLKSGPMESGLVSAADKLHNLSSLIRDYKAEGDVFLSRFHGSLKNQLWFYEEVIKVIATKVPEDNILLTRLAALHKEALEYFKVF